MISLYSLLEKLIKGTIYIYDLLLFSVLYNLLEKVNTTVKFIIFTTKKNHSRSHKQENELGKLPGVQLESKGKRSFWTKRAKPLFQR